MSIANLHVGETAEILEQVRPGIEQSTSLQGALQVLTSALMDDYADSVVLVRAFVTVAYEKLPAAKQAFAQRILPDSKDADVLKNDTPVLSLLATSGREPNWNTVEKSKGNICIPLMSDQFVAEIQMVSRLLTDLGLGVNLGVDAGATYSDDPGSKVRTFYVSDALTEVDGRGRKVIVNQQFAEKYAVKTVFGGGGPYPNHPSNVLAVIFFTNEQVSRDVACAFEPLIASVQACTEIFLKEDHLF